MKLEPSQDPRHATVARLECELGRRLRTLRLDRNFDQTTLAAQAGVGLNSLRRLELGHGSTTHTLISVVRALGRVDWLATVAPVATVNPVTMLPTARPRQRAARRRLKRTHG